MSSAKCCPLFLRLDVLGAFVVLVVAYENNSYIRFSPIGECYTMLYGYRTQKSKHKGINKRSQVSNIRRTAIGNQIVDHSNIVGAPPVGAAPTTSSFSTKPLA